MSQKQLHVIAVQPYGYIDGPTDHGSGARGSRIRANRAIFIARNLSRDADVIFLFPQGFGKEHPTVPGDRPVSLGESMARYVESALPEDCEQAEVRFEPRTWGTFDDVKTLPGMLGEHGANRDVHIHFVTDPVHLKRVRLVWNHVGIRRWKAYFHPAPLHRMTWRERWIREPLARWRYRYRILSGR